MAAPWIWLHFSTELSKRSADGEENQLERYKFISIVLAVVLLVWMIKPLLPDWAGRVNKFEALGVSVSLTERETNERSTTFSLAGNQFASTTSEQLSVNTNNAYRIGDVENESTLENIESEVRLETVKTNLAEFEKLSTIDRDRVFIAYLVHELYRDQSSFSDLGSYVSSAERRLGSLDEIDADLQFVKAMSPMFACLADYAKSMGDFHLFLVDAGPTIESYIVMIRISNANEQLKFEAAHDLEQRANELMGTIRSLLYRLRGGAESNASRHDCDKSVKLTSNDALVSVPSGRTPYPMLIGAYTLAAIDSLESGIVLSSNWLSKELDASKNLAVLAGS